MKLKTLAFAVAAVASIANVASAQALPPVITVVPASAPNFFGSPSYNAWEANALFALENNLPVNGGSRLVTPTAYEASSPVISGFDNIVTGFPSWRGQAGPTGAFANELGNRIQFGVKIISPVTQFSIENVTSSATSTGSLLDYNFGAFGPGFTFEQIGAVGVSYGADGIKGTPDDVRYTSGTIGVQVNEAYYVGDGSAFEPDGGPFATVAEQQQAINDTVAFYYGSSQPFLFTGTYGLNGVTGSGSVVITPEPATLALLAGVGIIGLRRRRA